MGNLADPALACVARVWDRLGTGTCAQEYISNLADMALAPYVASMWDTGGSSQIQWGLPGSCRVFITHSTAFTTISHGTGLLMDTYGPI